MILRRRKFAEMNIKLYDQQITCKLSTQGKVYLCISLEYKHLPCLQYQPASYARLVQDVIIVESDADFHPATGGTIFRPECRRGQQSHFSHLLIESKITRHFPINDLDD